VAVGSWQEEEEAVAVAVGSCRKRKKKLQWQVAVTGGKLFYQLNI